MINIQPINALHDNYIWLIMHPETLQAIVIDPGEAQPVLLRLKQEMLNLTAILITHHHWDHTNGIKSLVQHYDVPVYGPATEHIPHCTHPLEDGDQVAWPDMGLELNVIAIPGHTHGHIAYVGHNSIFCGDTLFTGGCGRLFEGTAAQLHHSLCQIAALPDSTEIYCGHEYTIANLRFAQTVEPNNTELSERLREAIRLHHQHLPTVPSTLALELQTNPFLRCDTPSVQQAVNHHYGQHLTDPTAVFAALRQWKDQF